MASLLKLSNESHPCAVYCYMGEWNHPRYQTVELAQHTSLYQLQHRKLYYMGAWNNLDVIFVSFPIEFLLLIKWIEKNLMLSYEGVWKKKKLLVSFLQRVFVCVLEMCCVKNAEWYFIDHCFGGQLENSPGNVSATCCIVCFMKTLSTPLDVSGIWF